VPHCQLNLFGGWSLTGPDGSDLSLPTRKDRQLLAYLAAQQGRSRAREKLASLLWSDRADEQAPDSLRQSLAALRRSFRAAGVDALKTDRNEVSLDATALSTDVVTFAVGCLGSVPSAALAGLYRGQFLEGLDASTPEFERWVTQERQRLAALAEQLVCAIR
jgi:DNA-binding SARP family transcriptional activator